MSFIKIGENLVNIKNIAYISEDELNENQSVIYFIGGSKLRLPKTLVASVSYELEKGLVQ